MKAVEFVKDNPWLLEDDMKDLRCIIRDAKKYKFFCLNNLLGRSYDNHGGGVAISVEDLKRLVESHELVEKCDGLSSAKNLGGDDLYCLFKQPFIPTFSDIAQAIADVESVNA